MKLAFYIAKNGDWLDKTISICTRGKFSHCELVFSDDISFSASFRDGGVRFKKIDFGKNWELMNIDTLDLDESTTKQWANSQVGHKYDILGALTCVPRLGLQERNKWYCSELCAAALGFKKINLSPIQLYRRINEYYR